MTPLRSLTVLLALASVLVTRLPAGTREFHYQNPITDGIDPHGLRDCQVLRDGGSWYLTGTAWPHWEREETGGVANPGVVLYSSPDLLHWHFDRVIVPRPGPDRWYRDRFWAPEIHRIDGKYYATFNCRNDALGYKGQFGGYAVADRITGPYHVVTVKRPLTTGNDLTLFQDDDGAVWAFWNRGRQFGIGFARVDLGAGRLITSPTSAIRPGKPGHDWDSIGIEGPYVIKHDRTYYLFYSSWTRGYEIGYATAPKITGPWTKYTGNPFYGAQDEAACRRNGVPYTGTKANPFRAVGHNEIFTGPDGRLWLSCHGILPGHSPMLVIDPIWFDAAGHVHSTGPTSTPQTVICR